MCWYGSGRIGWAVEQVEQVTSLLFGRTLGLLPVHHP